MTLAKTRRKTTKLSTTVKYYRELLHKEREPEEVPVKDMIDFVLDVINTDLNQYSGALHELICMILRAPVSAEQLYSLAALLRHDSDVLDMIISNEGVDEKTLLFIASEVTLIQVHEHMADTIAIIENKKIRQALIENTMAPEALWLAAEFASIEEKPKILTRIAQLSPAEALDFIHVSKDRKKWEMMSEDLAKLSPLLSLEDREARKEALFAIEGLRKNKVTKKRDGRKR